jgi:CheY-like chemotaxis protein
MKILIVEDDDAEAEIAVEAFLEVDSAAELTIVNDGEAALNFLKQNQPFGKNITDLVLLDLNLPGKDGRAVLIAIKSDPGLAQIPVIVLSNSDAREDIEFVYRNNGNSYVVKPPDMNGMFEFVELIKCFWGDVVQLAPSPRLQAA